MRQANRLILNMLSNYSLTVVSILAAFLMTPIVTRKLGDTAWGVANLVLVPFSLFEQLSNSIGRALHRYIPQDLASEDRTQISRTFNTAMAGLMLLGLVGGIVVCLFRGWLLGDAKLDAAGTADSRMALWAVIGWLIVGMWYFGYRRGLEALQRFDLVVLYNGVATVARMLIVALVFYLGHGSITFFVVAQLVALLIVGLLCRRSLKRSVPELRESPRYVDRRTIGLLGVFASATLLMVLGDIMVVQGFRLLVEKCLGAAALGAFAAIVQLSGTVQRLIDDLSYAFMPAVSSLAAKDSMHNIAKLLITGTKSSVAVASSLCLVPITVAQPFFLWWLKGQFSTATTTLVVLLLNMVLFCVGNTPLQVLFGLGKLRLGGPVMFIRGAVGLVLAYAFVRFWHGGLLEAALSMYGIQMLGSMIIFVYACRETGVSWGMGFLEVLVRPVALGLVGMTVTWMVGSQIGLDRLWKMGVAVCAGNAVYLLAFAVVGVTREERRHAMGFVQSAISKMRQMTARVPAEQP